MQEASSLHFVVMLGSLRERSYHAAMARAVSQLAPAGIRIDMLGPTALIPHYDADLQEKGFPAKVLEMAEAIRSADGVIIVTPEYNFSVPGTLKNAFDWLSRVKPQPFAGKPVAIQTASPGPVGGARVQYHLRQILVFLDAFVLNKPEVIVGNAATRFDPDTMELTDPTARNFITAQLEAFAMFARRIGAPQPA